MKSAARRNRTYNLVIKRLLPVVCTTHMRLFGALAKWMVFREFRREPTRAA